MIILSWCVPLLLCSCGTGKKNDLKQMNSWDVEEYLIGEWSDESATLTFGKDKKFLIRIKPGYSSPLSEMSGEYQISNTNALIFFIEEGRYENQTIYPKQFSAGAKILEINKQTREMYLKCYMQNVEVFIGRVKKE